MRRKVRIPFTCAISACTMLMGCAKSTPESSPPEVSQANDAGGDSCDIGDADHTSLFAVIGALSTGDRSALLELCDEALGNDLSESAFADLSSVIRKLGTLQTCSPTGPSQYELSFEGGTIEARLSLDEGRLHGMYFAGEAFEDAQHSALGDADLRFKVYDFYPAQSDGTRLEEPVFLPGRQHFIIVVGGFQAREGEHHVILRKKVTDGAGQIVFDSPEEMDITFARNLEGVRTAMVLKYVDLDKPGTYRLALDLEDQVSGVKLQYADDFIVTDNDE